MPVEVTAVECGYIARRVLRGGCEAVVCASFRRSYYLRSADGALVCVGDAAIGRAPLNVRVDRFVPRDIGECVHMLVAGASTWRPRTVRGAPVGAALAKLRTASRGVAPRDGLGALVTGQTSPLARSADAACTALRRWLAGEPLDVQVFALLGLGPGLTPSGDDYLGGVMLALRAFGKARRATRLWSQLRPLLRARTSTISAAHLAAAAEGTGHESVHACIESLIDGPTTGWPARLRAIAAIGHCSGWDALAGVAEVACAVPARNDCCVTAAPHSRAFA